jgi:hypothetical protein
LAGDGYLFDILRPSCGHQAGERDPDQQCVLEPAGLITHIQGSVG